MRHAWRDDDFVPSAPLTAQNAPPAFRLDVVRSVRMYKQLALGVAAAVFVLVVLYALTRRPVYQAESLTYVEPLATKVMSDGSPGFYDPSRYDSYIDQQIQTAQRPDILAAAAAKLPEGVWRRNGESVASTAARLAAAIQVKRVGTSYQLSITGTGPDPVGTAAAVNAVTDAFLEQGSKDEHAMADGRIQLLSEERQRIQNELQQANAEQNTLSASLGVANPSGDSGNPYDAQLENLRTELAQAREAHDVAAAQLESMSMHGDLHSAGLAAAANDTIAGDSGLSTMKASINQRRAALEAQMAGLTPTNPVYKLDQQEIAAMDHNLDTMTGQLRGRAEQNLQDKLRQELERTGEVESKLNAQLASETARATSAAPKLQRATELTADIARLQAAFAEVDASLRALQLETQGPGLAHLSVAATPPSAPVSSRRTQLLLLALPLAFLAGIAAAVIARKRDPHAYTARDLQHTLGFPPMAVLPAQNEVSEVVMEEYLLRLAAGVERAHRKDGARSFVFTAVSADTEVAGLLEALARKLTELGFHVNATDVNAVLHAGDEELVEGRRGVGAASMRLSKLQQDFDLLLLEARPLLFSAATEYAATAADATVLVAESGVTLCKELKDAGMLLDRLHVRGVAAVLNDLHLAVADARFVAAVEELERSAYSTRRREARERKAADALPPAFTPPDAPNDVAESDASPIALQPREVEEVPVEREPVIVQETREPKPVIASPVTLAPLVEAAVADSAVRDEDVEPKIEEPAAESKPIRLPAQRKSFMSAAEQHEQPKPSFFDRIFKRFHEPVVSILPDLDDEDGDAAEIPTQLEASEQVPPPAAEPIAELASAQEFEVHGIAEELVTEEEVVTEIEEASALSTPLPEPVFEPATSLTSSHAAEETVPEIASAEIRADFAPLEERSNASENQDVAWDVAAERHALAASETPAVVAAPVAHESEAVVEPEAPVETAPSPAAVEMMRGPEPQPTYETETAAPVQGVGQVTLRDRGASPLTPPTMRQWEFRQARSMRETAANAARMDEESVGYRRPSRPGVVSATGRRTLVEEATVAPRRVASWTQEPEPIATMPARKWGMLSRFDQRFQEQQQSALDTSQNRDGAHEEEEMVTSGPGRNLGAARD